MAEATGRTFRMLWPRTPHCGATFQELFCNAWPVEDVSEQSMADLPFAHPRSGGPPDLLAAADEDVVLGGVLVRPDLYPSHAKLAASKLAYWGQLQPVAAIDAVIRDFRARHFRPTMIGVHLRRGDFATYDPDAFENTSAALAATTEAMQRFPDANIFLASDDGAPNPNGSSTAAQRVRELFAHRFGDRVVWTTPRSLERGSTEAVQDGLVDLWLLRQTDYFIGTTKSGFSHLVIYGHNVPNVFCNGGASASRQVRWLTKITGYVAKQKWRR